MSRSVNAETVTKDYYFINAKRIEESLFPKKFLCGYCLKKKKNLDCALTKYLLKSLSFI